MEIGKYKPIWSGILSPLSSFAWCLKIFRTRLDIWINAETVWQFFHKFIECRSTTLYREHVITLTTKEEAEEHICDFHKSGFPGCVASTDATHIALENCSHRLKDIHKGFKLKIPSGTYNISDNHWGCILHSTCGHPTNWNDKTLQCYGTFMDNV